MLKLLFIVLIAFSNCSHRTTVVSPKQIEYSTIVLDYKSPVIGGCGNYLLAYRFKFKNANDSFITCIIRCPDSYGESFFVKGKSYKAKLSSENIKDSLKNYTIVNTFENDTSPVYLTTEITKAP